MRSVFLKFLDPADAATHSYVHGIMDGKVLLQPRPRKFQHYSLETFHLA